ncbi:MAG: DUF2203 family protein [Acidobacteria bacterium]|nr:DUF2203 family protein [Acidobacteriota bacterium]NIM63626.1 DUF2203 family protein [Acidobacteriota bacterium]NIO59196.1 DUF2203 family protein [Acidobacteriota bacterium]NIQ30223.1 DUF2203 family protein [Acidobacteriota bacterium]NIQ85151.1 DUF2203 family protein [Acidobacteriota bacterium]
MSNNWFTPHTARLAAQRLEPLASRVSREFRRLQVVAPMPVTEGPVEPAYFAAVCRFHRVARRLSHEGVLFRDLAKGWFEFPARRAGRTVLLAWRLGEPVPAGWSERGQRDGPLRLDESGPWDDPADAS